MNSIHTITLEVADPQAAANFYKSAFGDDVPLDFRASEEPTSGFRGFSISLVVSQPSTVHALFDAAVAAGATTLKPAAKSFWGVGGVVQAPDGTIWKIATSAKKNTDPADRTIDEVVILLGAGDVKESKQFYVGPRPRTRAFRRRAPVPTGSSSAAGPGRSPTPMVSSGRARAGRARGQGQPACAASLHRPRPVLPTLGP